MQSLYNKKSPLEIIIQMIMDNNYNFDSEVGENRIGLWLETNIK